MKKYLMTLVAVLCCAMTTSVLTACGGDDDNDNSSKSDTTTPKNVELTFYYHNTADMIKYCNVELAYDDGKGNKESVTLTENMGKDALAVGIIRKSDLPVTFKFTRKVTMKQDVGSSEKVEYTSDKYYIYTLYNAEGKKLNSYGSTQSVSSKPTSGANFVENVNNGKLDYEVTLTFNAKGELVAN